MPKRANLEQVMDGDTILTWNATNWITVVLMVFLGFMIVGGISHLIKKQRGNASNQ